MDDPGWLQFVNRHPAATPFHMPAWVRTVSDTYGLPAFVYVVRDARGAIAAGLPLVAVRPPLRPPRWVSLPFTDFCPPLAGQPEELARLGTALDEARAASGIRRVEIRAPMPDPVPGHRAAYRHVLALDGQISDVFSRFHRSQVQRNIRRAEDAGMAVRIGTAQHDLLDDFYPLHLATRRRLGVPIQPRRFWSELRRNVLGTGLGHVVTVSHRDVPVAAAVFLATNRTLVYKFGASDSRAWALRPNHLLFWTAIQRAVDAGVNVLDFGRTDAEAEGLRAFKKNWGAVEQPLVYSTIGEDPPTKESGTGAGLARRAAGSVIRIAPAWVCRAAGEVLYRFAA